MKSILIALSVRLQSIPFVWGLSLIYRIAVRVAVFMTKRVPGVVAIYLTGSMARGRAIPGLSDIDFKIFVEGARNPAAFKAIRDGFALLRHFFPMLGPPDEKGIYFLDDFESDYLHYPLLRFLFDESTYHHRLLWGNEIIGHLPVNPLIGDEAHLPFVWKFKDWMEKVVTLCDSTALSPIQERYLLYKAVSDVCAIYLRLLRPDQETGSREDCLHRMRKHLAPLESALIQQLILERKAYFRRASADREGSFSVFRHVIGRCLELMEGSAKGPVPPERTPDSTNPQEKESTRDRLASLCPPGTVVTAVPWQNLPLSPLDCTYFGSTLYLIKPPRHLKFEEILRIRDLYRSELVAEAAVMIRDDELYLYSPYSDLLDHWLSPRSGDDLMYFLSENPDGIPNQLEAVTERCLAYRRQLGEMVQSEQLDRIDRRQYLKLLFSTVRVLALCRNFSTDETITIRSPGDVISFLISECALADGFVKRLHAEYERVLEKGGDFDEAFMKKSRCLMEALAVLDWEQAELERLASLNRIPDLESLSISVIVITRSRSRQLKRCLDSMARLERHPDELIVVDNGSTDDTVEVVHNLNVSFPVRYVYESEEGIGIARNRGVQASTSDICAFTDDDAVVDPGWLSAVEKALLRDPKIGIVGGRIENLSCDRGDAVYRYFEMTAEM